MKELIHRDYILMRKNLFRILGISFGIFLMGLLFVMSAKFGNIAKYDTGNNLKPEIMNISVYFAVVAGIFIVSIEEEAITIVHKDYISGWHNYLKGSGMKPELIVGEKYLLITCTSVIGVLLGTAGYYVMYFISGGGEVGQKLGISGGLLIMVGETILLTTIAEYFLLIEYLSKGHNSRKVDYIKALGVIVLMLIVMLVCFITLNNQGIIEDLLGFYKLLLARVDLSCLISALYVAMITVICYLLSVRIVKKEGRRV